MRKDGAARPVWRHRLLGLILLATAVPATAANAWSRIATPSFTLLSCAPERETLDWAVEFEAFFTEVSATLPTSKTGRTPLTFLLFPSDSALAPLKPVIDGRPHSSAAFVFRLRSGAMVIMSAKDPENVQRRLIYHDAVHWIMGSQANRLPLWFQEGLAELFSTFAVQGSQRSLGLPIAGHVSLLQRESLLPMARFLTVGRDSWLYNETTRVNPFYAQAWAFAHLVYLNRDLRFRSAVAQYLKQENPGDESEAAFRAAFGLSYSEMEQQIANFLSQRRYGVSRMPINRDALLARVSRGPPEPGEIARVIARVQLAQGRYEDATRFFRAAHTEQPDDPLVLLSLGELALRTEGYEAAFNFFDRAIAHGMDLECAYLWRAQTRHYLASTPKGSGKQLAAGAARQIADDYIAAARRNPGDFQTLRELSGPLASAQPRRPEDRTILEQAVKRWPGDPLFIMNLAALDFQEGRNAEARRGWQKVIALNPSAPAAIRQQAEGLLAAAARAEVTAELERLQSEKDPARVRRGIDALLESGAPLDVPRAKAYLQSLDQREELERAIALIGKDDREAERTLSAVAQSPHSDLATKSEARRHLRKLESSSRP